MLKKVIALLLCFSAFSPPAYAISAEAESSIVICADTNQILYAENHHKKLGMASTTKIMTAICALEHGNSTDTVNVSMNASRQEGSSIYLKAGDKLTLEDLLYGLMLNSGNDAAMAIAEHISGSCDNFVALMNEKALELGCKNTHFENPSGLPVPDHYSTAYDMAIIMSYAIKNDAFLKISGTKEHKIETEDSATYLRNHNKLLWQYPYAISGKTGYTKACGRCFVSCAKKDDTTLVCVTLNDPDDWRDHQNLLDFGFEKVKMTSIIDKNEILCTRKIRGVRLNILSGTDISIPLKDGKKHRLSCKIKLDESINGEIRYGTHLGTGDIYLGKNYVGSIDLISGQSISSKKQNIFDTFGLIFNHSLL